MLNRTATFVFFLGERHFGTITAYVPGPAAERFRFTSALPVSIVKLMAPLLEPVVRSSGTEACPLVDEGNIVAAVPQKPAAVIAPSTPSDPAPPVPAPPATLAASSSSIARTSGAEIGKATR